MTVRTRKKGSSFRATVTSRRRRARNTFDGGMVRCSLRDLTIASAGKSPVTVVNRASSP